MGISTRTRRNPGRRGKAVAVVAAAAAAIVAGAPVATAAPSGFEVIVRHSSGTIVGHLTGNLSWSTSGRTVTFSNQALTVKSGECVDVAYAGYQGNTRVTDIAEVRGACLTGTIGDFPLATDVPGGIQQVNITLTDVEHRNKASIACRKDQSVCHA